MRRRARLIAAAGELLCEGGSDAIRHRAVATRADLPLASTTYYFESIDDLVVEAVAHTCRADLAAISARADSLTTARRGRDATASILAQVMIGPDPDLQALTARVEAMVLASRSPRLAPTLIAHQRLLYDIHHDVLARCGRDSDVDRVATLVAIEHGSVAVALSEHDRDIVTAMRLALCDVIDDLAPASVEPSPASDASADQPDPDTAGQPDPDHPHADQPDTDRAEHAEAGSGGDLPVGW